MYVGRCHIDAAKLWALFYGLNFEVGMGQRHNGFRRIAVEMDSSSTVRFVREGVPDLHPNFNLISACRELRKKDWCCTQKRIYR